MRIDDYELVCPPNRITLFKSVAKKISAKECWRRYRTYCENDGSMANEFEHPINICNVK